MLIADCEQILVIIQCFARYLLHLKFKKTRINKRDKSSTDFNSCMSPLYGFPTLKKGKRETQSLIVQRY